MHRYRLKSMQRCCMGLPYLTTAFVAYLLARGYKYTSHRISLDRCKPTRLVLSCLRWPDEGGSDIPLCARSYSFTCHLILMGPQSSNLTAILNPFVFSLTVARLQTRGYERTESKACTSDVLGLAGRIKHADVVNTEGIMYNIFQALLPRAGCAFTYFGVS